VRAVSDAGRDVWVCPGTSSWNSLFGRTTNMIENQCNAARVAREYDARGFLVTDWGDGGHLQYLPASEPGFAHAGAVASDAGTDGTLGPEPWVTLGDVHRHVARQTMNIASYLVPLWLPHIRRSHATSEELDAIEADLIAAEPAAAADAELANSIALARVVVDDGRGRNAGDGTLSGIDPKTRTELADRLEPVIDAHRALWLARNRPGGLDDSVSWLERLRDSYRAGDVDPNWLPPGLRPCR